MCLGNNRNHAKSSHPNLERFVILDVKSINYFENGWNKSKIDTYSVDF
jgi:hypothetical protein